MAVQGYNLEQTGPQVQEALDKIIVLSPATTETAGTMSATDKAKLDALPSGADLTAALADKVDKVTGKGLSTNDFTDSDKTKLAGVESGAQANVIETVKVNGTALTPVDKAVDIDTKRVLVIKAIPESGQYTAAEFEAAVCSSYDFNKLFLGEYAFVKIPGVDEMASTDDEYLLVLKTPDTGLDLENVSFIGSSGVYSIVYKERVTSSLKITVTTTFTAFPTAQDMAAWAAKYTKPASGIPPSDMEAGAIPDAVEANPTVPSGTTPTDLTGLKIGSGYYAIPDVSGKQDTIADLQSIRSGAAAGASAYQMPGTGIPKTDLEQSVQTCLEKADTALQEHQDLTPITGLIPSQATPQNQLADKKFVNSSIATATADFKGTFLTLAALQAVTADNNDYGYVVSTDAAGNTVYNRYKYDGSAWTFEYALNNSSFTAAEWAAIQSGITQALVTKLQAIEAGAQVNVLEGIKRNGSALVPVNKVVDMSVPDLSTSIEEDKTSDSKAATPKAVHDITGSLSGLRTAAKNSLVAAINEAAASGGEVEEAPTNGDLYVRRNGAWVKAEHLSERGVSIDFGINEDVIGWLNMFGAGLTITRVVAVNCATIHVSYGSVTQASVTPGTVNLPIPADSPVVWEITRTTDAAKAVVAFEFVITSNNS